MNGKMTGRTAREARIKVEKAKTSKPDFSNQYSNLANHSIFSIRFSLSDAWRAILSSTILSAPLPWLPWLGILCWQCCALSTDRMESELSLCV